MLNAIVASSLRHRGVVLALALVVLVWGARSAHHAELDVFPDFVPPQVVVQTEAPGLSPEQVEMLVTRPIESSLNGLGDMESLRSETIQGLSVITCLFKQGTNLLVARQFLAEKLAELGGTLPAGVRTPKMTPLTSATMDLLKVGLVSDTMTPMQLRTWADWTLKPRLLSVPGVAKCSSFGGEVRQWQIKVRPDRLAALGLSITDVFAAARVATGVSGAGFVENENQRILIQPEGQATTAASLSQAIIKSGSDGASIRIGDVATVGEGGEPKFGDCVVMGRPGVLLTMSSQYGANTMDVTYRLEAALEEMKPAIEKAGITLFPRLHRPATFIENALGHMKQSIFIGAGLVAIVLLLFIGNLRAAIISLTAIPLSLLGTLLLMERLKIPLDTITLGGLAIAIGEVVDDAIIDVENILRRLRANRALPQPLPAMQVVLAASLEVRTAVVFATFVVALVFLPVLALGGVSGKFFSPLALSYILAILVSLLVAITVTPAMCLIVFRNHVASHRDPLLQRWLKVAYQAVLRPLARSPGLVGIGAALIIAAGLIVLPHPTGEFLPEFREGHLVVGLNTAPGTSIPEMKRLGTVVQKALLAIPGIATVEQQIGRAEKGEDPWGPHRSELHVDFKPGLSGEEEEETSEALREALKDVPGIHWSAESFLADRINESLAGEAAPVVLNLFGDDLDVLDAQAREVVSLLK
ncbi:MAG: CusA/CzcA family heavy metal efflux transporter, partial [Verrucomicrobiaceae bacterium]|nr:CusA/CzcA family heavy metal efflux transporter [Verrucomicrobiaceae bacterium]